MQSLPLPRINTRAWIVMAALAITGQIAWAVENTWFNTFVFDTITPDPRPIAWMVACSAITATLTTLFMGTAQRPHPLQMGPSPTLHPFRLHSAGGLPPSSSPRSPISRSPA